MDNKFKLIADTFGSDRVKLNEPIASHVALNVGGPAKLFFVGTHPREIIRIVKMSRELKLPILVFGTGSKMMISDIGFDGVIVKNRTSSIAVIGVKGKVGRTGIGVSEAMVEADSGVPIGKLVEFLKKQSLDFHTIENIPGTIGGNLFLSKALLETVQKIKVIDEDDDIIEIEKDSLNSRKHIILSVVFKFKTERKEV